ncbi:MAG: chemotaxis protein CheW [Opitutales bacterium]
MSQTSAATHHDSPNAAESARLGKFLSFGLNGQSYAVNVLKVREIIRLQTITALPQMPHYVRGVINLRGKVIPVVSLASKLGLPTGEEDERTCIIVLEVSSADGSKESEIGFVVEQVEDVFNLHGNEFEEPPSMGGQITFEGLLGLAKHGEVVRSVLDIDRVMGVRELSELESQIDLASA